MNLEKLKYPIGNRNFDPSSASIMKNTWIRSIVELPNSLERVVKSVSENDLLLEYRPDGWSIAQVIHHLADSHMNAYLRTKFALTENHPNVFGYEESVWANLEDARSTDIISSLNLIKGLHARWSQTFENMEAADFEKKYHHLGYKKDFDLMNVLSLYAWHSDHHLAHIHQALKYQGNFNL